MKNKHVMVWVAFGVILLAVIVVLTVALTGANVPVLQPAGAIAREQRDLLIISTLLMLVVVVPVFIMTFLFAWKFRAGNTKAKYTPNWRHNSKLEVLWWGIPCVIIAILATLTWITSHTLDPFRPIDSEKDPVRVQVVALQWRWLFIYPDDNLASINELVLPVDRPVNFEITSDAPMNSFWIPSLAGQVYAMSGMTTKLHVIADKTGEYKGSSANISGEGFAGMNFAVRVVSEQDYGNWIMDMAGTPKILNATTYDTVARPTKDTSVVHYTLNDDGLYARIIMKYMMPEKTSSDDHTEHVHAE